MALFRTSNPAMKDSVFSKIATDSSTTMTIRGSINKTLILLALAVASGAYTWKVFTSSIDPNAFVPWMFGGMIGGLVMALIVIFRPKTSPWAAPLYALLEGLFLGAISAWFEYTFAESFPGIVLTAVAITLLTLLVMLTLYRSGTIKMNNKLRAGIITATGTVALFYIVTLIMGLFGADTSVVHGSGLLSIGISIVIVIIAAMNFLLDFEFIEKGSAAGMPKHMEWYGAFGLMLTIVWLYLEILKLLAKLANR
ncbi:MAG: Bax inhibitor-1/YccA family protein [Prevotellaceae bacterium]|nr:Bax inhibitor-1/YccA family protein [Prevotellaceae bacterium]